MIVVSSQEEDNSDNKTTRIRNGSGEGSKELLDYWGYCNPHEEKPIPKFAIALESHAQPSPLLNGPIYVGPMIDS